MLNKENIYEIAKETAIKSIKGYIEKKGKEKKGSNFQVLDLVIPTERKIRSAVGGLETSMGTTLWEPLAKSIASLNGFEVLNNNLSVPTHMPADLQNIIKILEADRFNPNPKFNAITAHNKIKEACQDFIQEPITNFKKAQRGYGVDVWLKKDDINYLFDIKTVQPNIGSYNRYFIQLLNWHANFYSANPEKNAFSRIVFPYNPYRGLDFWKMTAGKGLPLEAGAEGWVQDDFWDFCSGIDNTFQIIVEAFNDISESGVLEKEIKRFFYK